MFFQAPASREYGVWIRTLREGMRAAPKYADISSAKEGYLTQKVHLLSVCPFMNLWTFLLGSANR